MLVQDFAEFFFFFSASEGIQIGMKPMTLISLQVYVKCLGILNEAQNKVKVNTVILLTAAALERALGDVSEQIFQSQLIKLSCKNSCLRFHWLCHEYSQN